MNIPLPLMSEAIKARFLGLAGETLSWVTFKLPDKNIGSLYLNYNIATNKGTAVSATAKYYTVKNPNLSQITFVPAKDYTGTSSIIYNAYTESGSVITGQINVRVTNSTGGTFRYVTDKNSPIQLDATDFQAAFLSATGKALSYVRFSPLSSSDGYLCYDYDLSGD
jgi:hypothetical protein